MNEETMVADTDQLIEEPQTETPGEPDPVQLANGLLYAAYERLSALLTAEMPDEMKRSVALAVTKTEEALLWFGRFQALGEMFQQQQASAEGNAPADSGLTVVEKPGLIVVGDPGKPEPAASETASEEVSQ